MDNGTKRFVAGLVAGVVILAFASWFDTTVMVAADNEATQGFDASAFGLTYGLGSVVVAGLTLAVAGSGWRCRSVRLGLSTR